MRHTARNAQGSQLGVRPSAEFCMISFYLQPLADGIRYKLGGLSPLKSAISVIEELSCYHMTGFRSISKEMVGCTVNSLTYKLTDRWNFRRGSSRLSALYG